MAILDLQNLKPTEPEHKKGNSGASKGCGNVIGGASGLSLLLC
jgi:hypothetical protein